jgi:hypothetical protein
MAQTPAEFLKSDEVGLVIAKGMAATYHAKPKNPVDFFARFLLNQAALAKDQLVQEERALKKQEILADYEARVEEKKFQEGEQAKADKEVEDRIGEFRTRVVESHDLEYELPLLVEHLKEHTTSTAVYIGKVQKPKRKIRDDQNDKAHIMPSAPEQIEIQFASEGTEFLVDKVLKQEDGITYDLFREVAEEEKAPAEEGEEGAGKKDESAEKLPKHIFVPEVVREERIHYFDVPKLGSYLAVKLEYDSCLSEEAFDAAFAAHKETEQKRKEQELEKIEWEQQQQQAKAAAADEDKEFVPEVKEWAEITEPAFITQKVQYCVLLNTMGQDREYTEEQKLFALREVQTYRDQWEKIEQENLRADVAAKVDRLEKDGEYKEKHLPEDEKELGKVVDEAI